MWTRVSIILLNYNGLLFNNNCIDSLLQQSYINFEIIFVNNFSTDGSCEEVERKFIKQINDWIIKVIQPWYNTWFAMGNNIGVQHSDNQSEYICLLNNDVTVPTNRLERLIKGIESDSTLGAVGSVIYDQGYEEQIHDFLFKDYKKGVNNYFFDSITAEQTDEDKAWNVIYTTGISWCCLLYKKSLLPKPFDDIYFAYMEDTALCIKIVLQWYRVGIVKDSIVHHVWSASFGKEPTLFKVFHGMKNYMLNFILLSQWYRWIIVLPWLIVWIFVRSLFSYPFLRIQWLGKALRRVITHGRVISDIKKNMKVTIASRVLYQKLSEKFISTPFYTQPTVIQQKVISMLNFLSIVYFMLFKYLIR